MAAHGGHGMRTLLDWILKGKLYVDLVWRIEQRARFLKIYVESWRHLVATKWEN